MTSRKDVDAFIKSQRSIHLYPKFQKALLDVLMAMPDSDYRKVTRNVIFMVLHEIALGQAMHIRPKKGKFCIVQISIARRAPAEVLRYVIAHELGHVLQARNWRKGDSNKLEIDADKKANEWGFPKTESIKKWMSKHRRMAKKL